MKRNIFVSALLVIVTAISALGQDTEESLRFRLLPLESEGLPAEAVTTIERKLRAAFNRTESLTEDPSWSLEIRPELDLEEAMQTEGMVIETGKVSGNMMLTAQSAYDGTQFHSAVIPLTASAAGGKEAAMKALAASIKPTDPVFVRFIRNARKKVAKYYQEHPVETPEE